MNAKPNVANNLKRLRKARGVTQTELAKKLGVSLATVQNWEMENTDMTGYSLFMLCDYFNVSPNEIYGTGDKDPYWDMRNELISLFDSLSNEGKTALIASARGIANAFQPKSNQHNAADTKSA